MSAAPRELVLIPAGQSLTLVTAIGNIINAALPGTLMGVSTGHGIAATLLPPEGMPREEAAGHLVAAARKLSRKKPEPVEVPPEELGHTLNRMSQDEDGGIVMRLGAVDEADEAAREMAMRIIAGFAPYFEEHPEAGNYTEYTAIHPDTGERWTLTVRKPTGRTPHELRAAADRHLSGLVDTYFLEADDNDRERKDREQDLDDRMCAARTYLAGGAG